MKKSIILALSLTLSVATFAQQLATLNHNGNTTAYYGMNALQQAHAAAVNGDIITLSSGIFNSVDITKAVTIRGAGAWIDTNGKSNTILYNGFTLNVPEDTMFNLVIEGVYAMNKINMASVYNPLFRKCHFVTFGDFSNGLMRNANFENCIVEIWRNYKSTNTSPWPAQGTQFINSVVLSTNNGVNVGEDPATFINCILAQNPNSSNMLGRLFQNCIMYYNYSSYNSPTNNSSTAFNCMFVNTNTSYPNTSLFSDMANHVLWSKIGMNTVFKTFDGTYGSTTTFELQDSIAANYLGTDGTQIGIYGGFHPFSPKVTSPVIKSINVAQRNNSEGKLEVNIEMVTEDE